MKPADELTRHPRLKSVRYLTISLQLFNNAYDAHPLRVWRKRSSNFKRKEARGMKVIRRKVLVAVVPVPRHKEVGQCHPPPNRHGRRYGPWLASTLSIHLKYVSNPLKGFSPSSETCHRECIA
jgi:hypothetical protein